MCDRSTVLSGDSVHREKRSDYRHEETKIQDINLQNGFIEHPRSGGKDDVLKLALMNN